MRKTRGKLSYFRVPFLIFVPSLLSESLEQAKLFMAGMWENARVNNDILGSKSSIPSLRWLARTVTESCFLGYTGIQRMQYYLPRDLTSEQQFVLPKRARKLEIGKFQSHESSGCTSKKAKSPRTTGGLTRFPKHEAA